MNSDARADQAVCTERLLAVTPDAFVVSNLGVASYVLAGVADRPRNCYLWGSMGVTTAVGLGLSLSVDDPVTVLDGDGSMLMSLGVLATVAACDPPNLTVVVWKNDQYLTTGGQPTPTDTVDFAGVARHVGLEAVSVDTVDGFEGAYQDAVTTDRPTVIVCSVESIEPDARPPFDFAHVAHRVRAAAGCEDQDGASVD